MCRLMGMVPVSVYGSNTVVVGGVVVVVVGGGWWWWWWWWARWRQVKCKWVSGNNEEGLMWKSTQAGRER